MQDGAVAAERAGQVDFVREPHRRRAGGAAGCRTGEILCLWMRREDREGESGGEAVGGVGLEDEGDGRVGGVNVLGEFDERGGYLRGFVLFGEEDVAGGRGPLKGEEVMVVCCLDAC